MCQPFGRYTIMTRPNKIFSETMSYNLTIEKKDYDKLRNFSTKESETYNMQVSVADLIRTSVKLYLEDLEKAYAKRQTEDTDKSEKCRYVDCRCKIVSSTHRLTRQRICQKRTQHRLSQMDNVLCQ